MARSNLQLFGWRFVTWWACWFQALPHVFIKLSSFFCAEIDSVLFWSGNMCFLVQCSTEFINLISSESNEICSKEEKRTIAPEHVLRALEVCYPCFECLDMHSSHVVGWLVIQLSVEPLFLMPACELCICLLLYLRCQEAYLGFLYRFYTIASLLIFLSYDRDLFSNNPINRTCLTALVIFS